MTDLNEYTYVEKPFLDQLEGLGWDILELEMTSAPEESYRSAYSDIIIERELAIALKGINSWMEDDQIREVTNELTRIKASNLMETNMGISELLLNNTVVDENRETGAKSPSVKYIDFENIENNRFLAVSQFKVNVLGTHKHIIPDIVLFVNGIPLVVVECKSPKVSDPMWEAKNQLLRYCNNRPQAKEREGNERLFHYNQFMIATYRQEARFSTISGGLEHYLEWKDCYPFKFSDINTDGSNPNSQQILVQGMLHPENFLDIVHNFTIFKENDKGKVAKIVSRYQQYRAVRKIIERISEGNTPAERGGVVWHTQGSGKSLTMVFLIRKMRKDPQLKKYKVVLVTDRTDLQTQLGSTANNTDETVYIADSIEELKDLLKSDTSNLVMGMMQKCQVKEKGNGKNKSTADINSNGKDGVKLKKKSKFIPLPVLNRSENILLLIDEAHRTQSSNLHASLSNALPNCTKIAFTGTPLITEKAKKKTTDTFGDYIDKYTIEQSVKDGSTLQIIYEGRTSKDAVKDGKALDDVFEDMFRDYTPQEREAIQAKYGTKTDILSAPKRIEAIAKDIVDHYRKKIMENGFKAQVVTSSRKAAMRYKEYLDNAIRDVIEELETQPEDVQKKEELDTLKRLETAVVISGDHNDPVEYATYTDRARQNRDIEKFKKPLKADDPEKQSGVAFLIVKDMLITGFDAPVEQVMYIDRKLIEHNLLQAIARVNRPASGKNYGLVVDYYGIGNHLKDALKIFTATDVKGALIELKDEIPKLRERHDRAVNIFEKAYISSIDDIDACVDYLADEEIRAEFIVAYKYFLKSMDTVLPNPAALPYVGDMKTLSFIKVTARNRYRDDNLNIEDAEEKVKKLIDEYIISKGIDPKIPPISIMAEDFETYVTSIKSPKSKASEMEHAIRYHISKNIEYDPEFYQKMSERLEDILTACKENWEELSHELEDFLTTVRSGREMEDDGLDPVLEKPFYDIIVKELYGENEPKTEDKETIIGLTSDIVSLIKREIDIIDFWDKDSEKKKLISYIVTLLVRSKLPDVIKNREKIAARFMGLAENLDTKLKES
ncbi:type I restriction endonuclease subunit R [Methanococcoides seepicolus]|uniref:type I site-specific deoxyribonuclease n=1 Tax=Methanococcoides seepicolus TaxID=2828780 RepID=A0A9E4ZGI1_9EURY|nr:type I restriction endonuclease subunit R [Methanococcoides seepicolus]MCM1987651.1 type I restriction endonuclease subunit R [Methanococcoides seepicolus]